MIYTPRHFQVKELEPVRALIERYNFATLISFSENTPTISHLPFMYEPLDGVNGKLFAHMARANPQWKSFRPEAPVTVVFQGPHAYISPRWYTPTPDNVPTWNYAVVHVHGIPKVVSEDEAAFAVMKRLVQRHDPTWTLNLPEQDQQTLLREIVVFSIEITKIDAKFKLSQNRSAADQAKVVEALAEGTSDNERETSELMRKFSAGYNY